LEGQRPDAGRLDNISDGGLAFYSHLPYELGILVQIAFPLLGIPDRIEGHVVRTEGVDAASGRRLVAVRFRNATEYAHTVEKLCHIESYRRMQEYLQGRELSGEEAAQEWVREYGGAW